MSKSAFIIFSFDVYDSPGGFGDLLKGADGQVLMFEHVRDALRVLKTTDQEIKQLVRLDDGVPTLLGEFVTRPGDYENRRYRIK